MQFLLFFVDSCTVCTHRRTPPLHTHSSRHLHRLLVHFIYVFCPSFSSTYDHEAVSRCHFLAPVVFSVTLGVFVCAHTYVQRLWSPKPTIFFLFIIMYSLLPSITKQIISIKFKAGFPFTAVVAVRYFTWATISVVYTKHSACSDRRPSYFRLFCWSPVFHLFIIFCVLHIPSALC